MESQTRGFTVCLMPHSGKDFENNHWNFPSKGIESKITQQNDFLAFREVLDNSIQLFEPFLRNKSEKSKVPAIQIPEDNEKLAVRIQMTTPTGLGEIKANFFSPNEKMLMSQFMVARAIAIMTSSRRKRREREDQVGDGLIKCHIYA